MKTKGNAMRKAVIVISILFIIANCLVACSRSGPDLTSGSTQATTASNPTTTERVVPTTSTTHLAADPVDLSTIGTVINVADLGLVKIHPSYLYWSPRGTYIVFMGQAMDNQGQETWGLYLFKPSDRSIVKIKEGQPRVDYDMYTLQWSQDENLLAFSFYDTTKDGFPIQIYRVDAKKLENMPLSGFDASFSLDNKQIAITRMDGTIVIYNLTDHTIDNLGGHVKGHSPIWFSDNKRIIFCKQTSAIETEIGTASNERICILDTTEPGSAQLFGAENQFYGISWLIPDELVNIDCGWDDVIYPEILDVKLGKITIFNENDQSRLIVSYRQPNHALDILVPGSQRTITLYDASLRKIGVYAFAAVQSQIYNEVDHDMDVLPDGRLIYFNATGQETAVIASSIDENQTTKVAFLAGPCDVHLSPDRDLYAFLCKRNTQLILVNPQDFLPDH
jgi:hypothetical protein